jgi:23S rRNA pseudouridine1911/1915/1917 synthase
MDKIKIIIPERMKGERIDVAISKMLPDLSLSKIHTAIKLGDTVINGKKFKAKDKSNGSEVVSFMIKKNNNNQWIAEKIPLNIIYEDEDIIILDKQSGLVTHPGPGNWSGTLANALLYYDQNLAKIDRAGIVHRLDKNTSGLMVVAKNLKSQKYLSEQLQAHSIHREYSAIVYGYMISGGSIDEPIGRDPKDRVKQAIINNGKEALTHYRLIDRFKNHTHVKAILETGRTHQIRVHLSHIGHPLIGDPIYGGRVRYPKKASQELKESLKNFERHALHSKKITLAHPISGEVMSWKSSLPVDMTKLLKVLKEFDNC